MTVGRTLVVPAHAETHAECLITVSMGPRMREDDVMEAAHD